MIELCPGVKSLSMFLAADDAIDPTMLRMLGVLGHTDVALDMDSAMSIPDTPIGFGYF